MMAAISVMMPAPKLPAKPIQSAGFPFFAAATKGPTQNGIKKSADESPARNAINKRAGRVIAFIIPADVL